MKYFDLKGYNAKAFRTIVLLGILATLIVFGFFFIGLLARYGEIGVVIPFLIALVVLLFLKRLFRTDYRVGVSEDQIVFLNKKSGMPLCAPIAPKEIAMIQHKINVGDNYLHFVRRGELRPFLRIATSGDLVQVREMLVEISKHTGFERTSTKHGWDQYISKEVIQNSPDSVREIRKHNTDPGKKNGKIIGIVAIGLSALVLAGIVWSDSEEGYIVGAHEITYNGEPLPLNPDESKWLGMSIIKDSSHVFFLGQIVEWADAPTFEEVGPTFFRDKNGLYREQINVFSRNKLLPLKGDFDGETLESVGNVFFKDKNRVYYFDYNLGSGNNPLKPVRIEGIDVPTFEKVDYLWYADKNHIYFGGWIDLRRCPEIDRPTFEVLTYQVAKDKNNVYYMTRFLTSEGGNRTTTERDNYAILKGAHAPSFVRIDRDTFKDDYNTWTIGDPKE